DGNDRPSSEHAGKVRHRASDARRPAEHDHKRPGRGQIAVDESGGVSGASRPGNRPDARWLSCTAPCGDLIQIESARIRFPDLFTQVFEMLGAAQYVQSRIDAEEQSPLKALLARCFKPTYGAVHVSENKFDQCDVVGRSRNLSIPVYQAVENRFGLRNLAHLGERVREMCFHDWIAG